MNTLWINPGACSLAVHILLEEIGEPFETNLVVAGADGKLPDTLLAVNPLRHVPVLETDEGVFTETTAILVHLAERHPDLSLFPAPRTARATHARSLMSFLATTPHPTFSHVLRPTKWVSASSSEELRTNARGEFEKALVHVDNLLSSDALRNGSEGPHVLGTYSVLDPYVTVFHLWARHIRLDIKRFPRLGEVAKATLARPATTRALEREGLAAVVSAARG